MEDCHRVINNLLAGPAHEMYSYFGVYDGIVRVAHLLLILRLLLSSISLFFFFFVSFAVSCQVMAEDKL